MDFVTHMLEKIVKKLETKIAMLDRQIVATEEKIGASAQNHFGEKRAAQTPPKDQPFEWCSSSSSLARSSDSLEVSSFSAGDDVTQASTDLLPMN